MSRYADSDTNKVVLAKSGFCKQLVLDSGPEQEQNPCNEERVLGPEHPDYRKGDFPEWQQIVVASKLVDGAGEIGDTLSEARDLAHSQDAEHDGKAEAAEDDLSKRSFKLNR